MGDRNYKEEKDDKIQSVSEDEDDNGKLDYQEEKDTFTNELLALHSDQDDDSDCNDKEKNMVNFLLP